MRKVSRRSISLGSSGWHVWWRILQWTEHQAAEILSLLREDCKFWSLGPYCYAIREPYTNDDQFILQFKTRVTIDNQKRLFIGYAHPFFINEMRGRKLSLFADGTFRDVPLYFYQVMIWMVYFP